MPEVDTPLTEIIGRDFDGHFISGYDADMIFPHFPRRVSYQLMSIFQGYEKTGIGQNFSHDSLHLKKVFFGHFCLSWIAGTSKPMLTRPEG